MLFDAVNMGAGTVPKFSKFTQASEGEWIAVGSNIFQEKKGKNDREGY